MSAARPAGGAVPAWEIATPARPLRLPGVGMAGFVDREPGPIDLRVVPHPAVTVVVDVGAGDELYAVDEASGRRQRGTVVAGLAHGSVRGGGREVACLQVRLSPTVAHQVFGAAAPLTGAVVALEDLWGRDAVRTQERLQAAGSAARGRAAGRPRGRGGLAPARRRPRAGPGRGAGGRGGLGSQAPVVPFPGPGGPDPEAGGAARPVRRGRPPPGGRPPARAGG